MPLEVEPSGTVTFPGPYTEKRRKEINIRNTGGTSLTYKLRTTVYERYNAKRHTGILAPGQATTIDVFLKPFEYDPETEPEHALLIRWVEREVTVDPKVFWRDMPVTDPDCNLHKISCILDENHATASYREKKAMATTTTTTMRTSFNESRQTVGDGTKQAFDPMMISVASGDFSMTKSLHDDGREPTVNTTIVTQLASPVQQQQQQIELQQQQQQQEKTSFTSTSLISEVKHKISGSKSPNSLQQLQQQQLLQRQARDVASASPMAAAASSTESASPTTSSTVGPIAPSRIKGVPSKPRTDSPARTAQQREEQIMEQLAKEERASSTTATIKTISSVQRESGTTASSSSASSTSTASSSPNIVRIPAHVSPAAAATVAAKSGKKDDQMEKLFDDGIKSLLHKSEADKEIEKKQRNLISSFLAGQGPEYSSDEEEEEEDEWVEEKEGMTSTTLTIMTDKGQQVRLQPPPPKPAAAEEWVEEKEEVTSTTSTIMTDKGQQVRLQPPPPKPAAAEEWVEEKEEVTSMTSTIMTDKGQQVRLQPPPPKPAAAAPPTISSPTPIPPPTISPPATISPRSPSALMSTSDPLAPPRKKDDVLFQVSSAGGATFYAAPERVTKEAIVLQETSFEKREGEEVVVAPMLHKQLQQPQEAAPGPVPASVETSVPGWADSPVTPSVEASLPAWAHAPVAAPRRQSSFKASKKPELEAEIEILNQLQQGQYQTTVTATTSANSTTITTTTAEFETTRTTERQPHVTSQEQAQPQAIPSSLVEIDYSTPSVEISPTKITSVALESAKSEVVGKQITPTPSERQMLSLIEQGKSNVLVLSSLIFNEAEKGDEDAVAREKDHVEEDGRETVVAETEVAVTETKVADVAVAEMEVPETKVVEVAVEEAEEAVLEKPSKARMKMPTAADTAEAAAAATAAKKKEEEALMLRELTKITKVLDDKLDVLDAFEVEARLRLSGVEEAVKVVERIAAANRKTTEDRAVAAGKATPQAPFDSVPAPTIGIAAAPSSAVRPEAASSLSGNDGGETKDQLNSLMSSLSLLEKSLDVLYFLEFETVNEEAQIKRLINIANKIHSHTDSKERLVCQLVERRQSLEHLEKESNMIIAKTESLKRKIHGSSDYSTASAATLTKEDEEVMRKLTARIEESVDTLVGIELSTVEMTDKTEKMIKTAGSMAAKDKTKEKPSTGDTVKEEDEQKMNLLMVTLKEIGRKTSLMEEMEKDAQAMLARTDLLQKKIKNLENMKSKQKIKEESISITQEATLKQESARISAMADVQEMKEVILKENPSSNKAIAKVDHFQEENRRQIEQQKSFSKQFAEIKNIATAHQVDDDIKFEENMSHLEEEHRQQLQHQAEMMCQIQQMKEMVQEDINHERQVEEEIRMKELLHLKEKERQKELIKQIRLMEEIEEIQQEHERQQFYHDQEQEMEIKEKELEHERNREHNMALMHQLELMTQINLIQDTVMILDEVNHMDEERGHSMSKNLQQIEKQLEILDEIERGTAIASERVDSLSERIKNISEKQSNKSIDVSRRLDDKIGKLEMMEQSTNVAIKKTEKMSDTVQSKCLNKASKRESLIPEKAAKARDSVKLVDEIFQAINTIEGRLQLLETMYEDVSTLNGQAEVLGDRIQQVQQAKRSVAQKLPLTCKEEVPRLIQPVDAAMPKTSSVLQKPVMPVAMDSKKHLNEIFLAVILIEGRVRELETMYNDVQSLSGQAEVLNDGIQLVHRARSSASRNSSKEIKPLPKHGSVPSHDSEPAQKKGRAEKKSDERALILGILTDLDKMDKQLHMLHSIEKATAIDVDRSEELVTKISRIGKLEKGITSISSPYRGQYEAKKVEGMPADTIKCLTAIENRLSVTEDWRSEKGMNSDLIDNSINKIKKLEKQLMTPQEKHELSPNIKKDEADINATLSLIAIIEQKLSKLEKLYSEVHTLQSQAEVLGDKVQEYEIQRRKSNDQEQPSGLSTETALLNSERLDGQMENIAVLEKEISDLLKESEMSSLGKRLESMDEWEVVDKQSIQKEMQPNPQQCMTSADLAKMKVGSGLQRSYSTETTELLAKVDGMKESVEEQKALRMLERENSLEYLDYGGTGGPFEQEAALLLERVDQGFTQIITDQSESHLMSSLKKELTPEKLASDTSLAEHEREKLHQAQFMRQIQEIQEELQGEIREIQERPQSDLHEQMKTDEQIASELQLFRQFEAMQEMHQETEDIPEFHEIQKMQYAIFHDQMKSNEQVAAELHEQRLEKDKQMRIQDISEVEAIATMRQTISNFREEHHSQQLVGQLDLLSNCLETIESEVHHLKAMMRVLMETSTGQNICTECKKEIPKDKEE